MTNQKITLVEILDGPYGGFGIIMPDELRTEEPKKGFTHIAVINGDHIEEVLCDINGFRFVMESELRYQRVLRMTMPLYNALQSQLEALHADEVAEAKEQQQQLVRQGRPSKAEYFLEVADVAARRSPCLRRQYGAVLVKDDRIIAIGYNGPVDGAPHCVECVREKEHRVHASSDYETCPAVHAEWNVLLQVSREQAKGATLYMVGYYKGEKLDQKDVGPCEICAKMLKQAGVLIYGDK